MSNFIEKPILLINSNFELTSEGETFLKSLSDKKISLISVIGPKSSGKSFLSNQLVGIFNNGFEIGSIQNTKESCTKGVWVWGTPVSHNGGDIFILILDVQGFQIEGEEQLKINQKIFNLINIISSTVIYNYKKDDESEETEEINSTVIKNSVELFNKLIKDEKKILNEKNISEIYFLYRDYNIKDTNKYLEMINSINKENEIYNTLYKNKINIFTLPPPMEENDMLINLYLDEEDEPFDDEYKKKINEFKKNIFDNIKQKKIGEDIIDINHLIDLINNFDKNKENNNNNININIKEEPKKEEIATVNIGIKKEEINKKKDEIIENIKKKLSEKNENISDIIDKIKNSYDILSNNKILNSLNSSCNNSDIEYLIDNINTIINMHGKELVEKIINPQIAEYNQNLNNLISQKEKFIPLLKEITKKEDIKEYFNNFKDEIIKDMNNILFNSKYEFLSCFKNIKAYFEKCVFNNMNNYINNVDNYINNYVNNVIKEQKNSENIGKNLDEKKSEINELKQKIENLNNELSELKQNFELKEKEFNASTESLKQEKENLEKKYNEDLGNLKQEKEKTEQEYKTKLDNIIEEKNKLEQEKNNLNEEKNNLIKESTEKNDILSKEKASLEEKLSLSEKNISELNDKNKELNSKINEYIEKENTKPKPQMINIKDEDLPKLVELFQQIKTNINESNDAIKLFLEKKSTIFHDKFIEETKKNINNKCENWVEELQKITKERFESKDTYYTEQIETLKNEKNVLNDELNKVKDDINLIKAENNNLKEEIKLVKDIRNSVDKFKSDKDKIINTLKNTNTLYEQRIKDFESKLSDMEFNLSNYKFESKMKEEEVDSTFNLFKSLLEKNKKNFESNLKKVPDHIKNEVLALNKKYKYIKI